MEGQWDHSASLCDLVFLFLPGYNTLQVIYKLHAPIGQRFFLESRIYTKRELHHVRVGNLAGGRMRAEASRRHFAHILVFFLA